VVLSFTRARCFGLRSASIPGSSASNHPCFTRVAVTIKIALPIIQGWRPSGQCLSVFRTGAPGSPLYQYNLRFERKSNQKGVQDSILVMILSRTLQSTPQRPVFHQFSSETIPRSANLRGELSSPPNSLRRQNARLSAGIWIPRRIHLIKLH
jgi:hypothetical protein